MRAMRGSPRLGKAGQGILESVIYRSLGASSSQLIVGPAFGADNSILRLSRGRVLVVRQHPPARTSRQGRVMLDGVTVGSRHRPRRQRHCRRRGGISVGRLIGERG